MSGSAKQDAIDGVRLPGSTLWRGSLPQKLRLTSGLVLFVFAATHFFNHALGLVSLDAMNAFDAWRIVVIRSSLGTLVLLASLLIHAGLGLWQSLRRRTLKLPAWEWVQIGLGVAIPVLLLPHIVNTRGAAVLFGVNTTYAYELSRIWPATFVLQSVLLLLVWLHGCIGLHYWLRLSPRYPKVQPVLFGIAVLLPFAALAGVSVQGRAIAAAHAEQHDVAAPREPIRGPDPTASAVLSMLRDRLQDSYVLLLAVLLAGGGATFLAMKRRRRIPVRYVGGKVVLTEAGSTILETSRRSSIPHLSVCGGRGRCSTCRVLVLSDPASLTPPSEAELKTLRAIGAGPHIRLACQARPTGSVTVMPLLKSAIAASAGAAQPAEAGVERDLAVLFVDMRGFTALSESKLPFDVVYILNQFFATVGQPIYDLGGWISNYAGDGVIALFSDERGVGAACRSALLAMAEIDRALAGLSARLSREMDRPLEIAMGLHAGPHVLGRVGFGDSQTMSAVGLAINVASRLEALAKAEGVQVALSSVVARHASLDISGLELLPIDVRGLSAPLEVIFVGAARDLLDRLDAGSGAPSQTAA